MQRKHLPAATFDVPAPGPISATETCRSALLSNYSGHLFFDVTARWRALLIISKLGRILPWQSSFPCHKVPPPDWGASFYFAYMRRQVRTSTRLYALAPSMPIQYRELYLLAEINLCVQRIHRANGLIIIIIGTSARKPTPSCLGNSFSLRNRSVWVISHLQPIQLEHAVAGQSSYATIALLAHCGPSAMQVVLRPSARGKGGAYLFQRYS